MKLINELMKIMNEFLEIERKADSYGKDPLTKEIIF